MAGEIPRGSMPVADNDDFMCMEDVPGYVHILVGGHRRCKLDGHAAEKLHAFVAQAISTTPRPKVLLNFSNVAYLNSQALGIIAVRIARTARDQNGKLFIYNPDPWVKQLIYTVRLDQILPILEELPELA